MGLMQPLTLHKYSFFWLRGQKKEYLIRKKSTLNFSAASLRKTEWKSLNADAFNLLASLLHFVHVRQPMPPPIGYCYLTIAMDFKIFVLPLRLCRTKGD